MADDRGIGADEAVKGGDVVAMPVVNRGTDEANAVMGAGGRTLL